MTTRQMWFAVAVMALNLLACLLLLAADKPAQLDQQGYMVWDAGCIVNVEKTVHAKAIAPLDRAGEPDRAHGWSTGLVVHLESNCGHIEIHPHNWDGK